MIVAGCVTAYPTEFMLALPEIFRTKLLELKPLCLPVKP